MQQDRGDEHGRITWGEPCSCGFAYQVVRGRQDTIEVVDAVIGVVGKKGKPAGIQPPIERDDQPIDAAAEIPVSTQALFEERWKDERHGMVGGNSPA